MGAEGVNQIAAARVVPRTRTNLYSVKQTLRGYHCKEDRLGLAAMSAAAEHNAAFESI